MKKIINKIKKLNNHGSSIVMVVVALGFIGIIIGALLSAAGYAYKLKLENKNSKNNFYYVEQAMQEIYAGVGAHTIEEMKEAYTYTVENMVRFDPNIGTYVTLDDSVANEMFKDRFMKNVIDSEFFAMGDEAMAEVLASYISNDTVKLDKKKVNLQVSADKIVIKDVTLTRMQEYEKSTAAGTYVQTISTDIVISEPDFSVRFNNMASDYSGIFKYALVGDMGVQIVNNTNLRINGNIYAAADYYNKQYNMAASEDDTVFSTTDDEGNVKYKYNLSPVTSKSPAILNSTDGYVNRVADETTLKLLPFDGENTYSMNSGLYMSGSNVTLVADRVIVPGTVAVMDSSELTVFGTAGTVSEVWTDNVVLGGSTKVTPVSAGDPSKGVNYEGSTAIFGGNLYVRDDTEINAKGSEFVLHGSYYGYGNSTSKDTRTFVPTVDKTHFQITNGDSTENRGHYNSSSIVINGENATLDLSEAKQIYLAGRAYIELSKDVKGSSSEDGSVYSETFTYVPTYTDADDKTQFIRDYKTAESISVKSNQVMYNISSLGSKKSYSLTDDIKFDVISLSGKPNAQLVFGEFFPEVIFGGNVPCVEQVVDGKTIYLVNFETAYAVLKQVSTDWEADNGAEQFIAARKALRVGEEDEIKSVNDLSLAFAMAYYDFVSANPDTELRDITAYDEFEAGNIIIPDNSGEIDAANMAQIYSSGAITTKSGNTFTMVTNNNQATISALLSESSFKDNYVYNVNDNTYKDPANAFTFSKDMEVEYNYLKWNLDHYNVASDEQAYVSSMISAKGESITPIHKYLVMNKINDVTNVTTLSGYKVILSDEDVVVKDGDNKSISGVIITKGDVTFDDKVESFEGMIVSGGKIYIGDKLKSLNASPNVCRGVLRDCITSGDAVALKILNVFKEYENYTAGDDGEVSDDDVISIDTIDYTQVVSMTNWMKNVGGGYDDSETP